MRRLLSEPLRLLPGGHPPRDTRGALWRPRSRGGHPDPVFSFPGTCPPLPLPALKMRVREAFGTKDPEGRRGPASGSWQAGTHAVGWALCQARPSDRMATAEAFVGDAPAKGPAWRSRRPGGHRLRARWFYF